MDKFDICYNISKQIIDNYIDLLQSPMYLENYNMYKEMVIKIRNLVFQEYVIIRSMTLEEICLYLDKEFTEDDGYDLDVIPRIKNRLVAYKEILLGKSITSLELGFNNISKKMDFSIYDSILSMINLEIIKNLNNKIDSLNPTCSGDKKFINSLYKILNKSKIDYLFNSSPVEILALFYNTNVNDIPSISIDKIKNKIKEFNNIEVNKSLETTLLIIFDKSINKLVNIENINNNSNDVFYYLTLVTTIEVIISYMDKNLLRICYDYCSKFNNDNLSINNIKELIKKRIKK